jgi:hypothetical protein
MISRLTEERNVAIQLNKSLRQELVSLNAQCSFLVVPYNNGPFLLRHEPNKMCNEKYNLCATFLNGRIEFGTDFKEPQ